MAQFAELDENNIVIRVIVAEDLDFCEGVLGGRWQQTSYNASMYKNYAGIGFTWDESRRAFIPPQPYQSWTLDEETCNWNPPVPYPTDDRLYTWSEETLEWVVIE